MREEIDNVIWLAYQKRWKCRECKKKFNVKIGIIFEDSPPGSDKWMVAIVDGYKLQERLLLLQIHRAICIARKSA